MTHDVWAVIRREYLQRVRSRWFVLATVGAPVLMAVSVAVPAWLASREGEAERRLVVVDRTGTLGERVAERLEEGGLTVEVRGDVGQAELEELRSRVRAGELEGWLVLDAGTLARGRAVLEAEKAPSPMRRLVVQGAVVQSALEARLQGEAGDSQALVSGGALEVRVLAEEGGGMGDPAVASAWAGSFVLYMVTLLYAVAVMRSVLEEKTSRVVEVVVSSVKPWHLMLGKILGVGAVGLTQLAVWVVALAVLFSLALPSVLAARPELMRLSPLARHAPGAGFFALFLVFFLCGYFMYSGLYAAVGAMCNSDEEAQQAQLPLMVLLLPPILLLVPVLESPSSTSSTLLSLVPFFSPVLMFARAVGGAAPPWQVALSVVLMVATVVGVAWVAGRIYRVGILMAGKRPTLPELMRWVREG